VEEIDNGEQMKKALEQIARLRNCDPDTARAFCLQVQELCHHSPSFADIALVISKLSPGSYTAVDVAERASASRGWENNVIRITSARRGEQARNVDIDTSTPGTMNIAGLELTKIASPLQLDFDSIHAETELYSNNLICAVAEAIRVQLFALSVANLVIGVTGNGPFLWAHVESLITKLGGIVDHAEIPWGKQDYIILGRHDFTKTICLIPLNTHLIPFTLHKKNF